MMYIWQKYTLGKFQTNATGLGMRQVGNHTPSAVCLSNDTYGWHMKIMRLGFLKGTSYSKILNFLV